MAIWVRQKVRNSVRLILVTSAPLTVISPAVGSISRLTWWIRGGLARARQAYDHKDLTLGDVERYIVQASHVIGLGLDLGLGLAQLQQRQGRLRVIAKNLGDAAHDDVQLPGSGRLGVAAWGGEWPGLNV